MLYFILKTFYHENFQNMQQWKEYLNELSHPVTVSLISIHTPPPLPTPILGLSRSKAQGDSPAGILTHGQSQMGYRSADISTFGSSRVGPGWQRPLSTSFAHPSVMGNNVYTHGAARKNTKHRFPTSQKLLRQVSQRWSSYFSQVSKDPCL